MGFTHFFVERPIFAAVISIIVTIIGAVALLTLPVAQYPEIAPPTVEVRASYPGASAATIADTVATPLEQEINGVENMLYMESQSTGDGSMTLTVTFALGTNIDQAQVLVQNRVAIAEPRLPEEVRRLGVTTRKNSPDLMMVVNLFSPDGTYDQLYIANYAVLQIRDILSRIDGVGQINLFGASEYAMRVWLDPDRAALFNLTARDIVDALRAQNVQIAPGTLNQPPADNPLAFQIGVQTQGRLTTPEEFENIIVLSDGEGSVVRLRDVGRVELGAQSYTTLGYLDDSPAIALPIFQRPGSNALETAAEVSRTMEELARDFPPGLEYEIAYNPTEFIQQSVDAVVESIFQATILVVLVVILFLQNWRASIIPSLAIPISLIGTFAVMAAFGFSLNNLSLFGLVLAIGVVVDNAIVVVENVERNLDEGLSPKEAAHKTMDEVGGALVAMSLVLVAIFLPAAAIEGIAGQFFRQFALTIAVATLFSLLVSLTLSPALAALLLKPKNAAPANGVAARLGGFFFGGFNRLLDWVSERYGRLVARTLRAGLAMIVIYAGLIVLAGYQFSIAPRGFIPAQDQGYFIVAIQLPPGAELARTDEVVTEVNQRLLAIDGIETTVGFAGFNGATFTNAPNAAAVFPVLADFETRREKGIDYNTLLNSVRMEMAEIDRALVLVIPPPPVRGIGTGGGFKMMVQDRRGRGLQAVEQAANDLAARANNEPVLTGVFTLFNTGTPNLFLDIDRVRAEQLGVPIQNITDTLEVYFGSTFVNDFNYLGRTFQVTAQADSTFRQSTDDLLRARTRNDAGGMVPIGSIATARDVTEPYRVVRFNLYPAAAVQGDTSPGTSSGEAIAAMEGLAADVLPDGLGFAWTELAFQEKQAGDTTIIVFVLSIVFVFLLLAATYESWALPLAVILIVPMCLLSAMLGINYVGLDNNILVQIGLVVLVGLAAKNAILIVEFARQLESQGRDRWEAAKEAARLRLRPILMTAFFFILGVVPLVIATGAGAEMRQALGIAVFSGMIGVTVFGLIFTPVFYVLCRRLEVRGGNRQPTDAVMAKQSEV
ncbi:MAG: multidrug efflux RND transporter permease subunit [Minwuiales bacterium]|nr:multidrug efflux RND transporter permease subunit [Minwuiales bacterium]